MKAHEMTDADRKLLRRKQDVLLMYLRGRFPTSYKISSLVAGVPTIAELAEFLYPEWEELIDKQIDLCQRRLI